MTYKTPVEYYIEGIVKTQGILVLPKVQLQKMRLIIQKKLNDPCCADDSATVNMLTTKNNHLVNTVEKMLELMPSAHNRKSLERSLKLIDKKLLCGACAPTGEPTFELSNEYNGNPGTRIEARLGSSSSNITSISILYPQVVYHKSISYFTGEGFVRLTMYQDATTPQTDFTISEDSGSGMVDTTSDWTIVGNVAEKTFTGVLPDIQVIYP